MIEIRDLYKSFNEKPVLKGVDLDVFEEEILVILGPSGQGKTVLIKTLVRLLKPDSGRVLYNGSNVLSLSKKEFREFQKKIAFVFQKSALLDSLNVRENIGLFLKMHKKYSDEKINREVHDTIEFVGLDQDVLDKLPEELSEGMKKRVAIARAMVKRPRYIFYDEPTTGLDKGNIEKVIELILLLKKEVVTTSVVVTHDIKLMQKISDRVALLKEGKIVFSGKKEELSAERLQDLYE
jgi:phospholipid/cholesterol/gamma-HCH transport system ATP-binding protein